MENPMTAPAPATDYSIDVVELVRMFEEADQSTQDARQLAERDRDYYDGKQWTAAEKVALKKRGQPEVTYNRIQRKVNSLKGLESSTRKDPKAFPRTPGDDGAAQAATDALRYVCDANNWDQIRSDAFENIIVEGTGAVFVGAGPVRGGIDPVLRVIPWDRLFYDPHSRRADFTDAAYMGIVTWMDCEDAKSHFPGHGETIDETWSRARNSETYDDRPKNGLWADYARKRVRIIELYYQRAGQWRMCTFTQAGHLTDPAPSPYLDEDKKPENPIKAASAYIDRENNRYGEVRAMISPQDEVNKRRSKALHLINSRQFRVSRSVPQQTEGGAVDTSSIKRELAKPDGVIVADDGEIEVLNTSDQAAANLQMLQEAKNEIDLISANSSLQGKNENDLSGRAIIAQQQAGMVEVALLMDRLRQLSLAVYRSTWARIQQYWTEPRWIRVTDDEQDVRHVGLNRPVTAKELARTASEGDPQAMEQLKRALPPIAAALAGAMQGDEQAVAQMTMFAQSPIANVPLKIENQVGQLDVDITIDEGMDTPTVAAEQYQLLLSAIPALANLPPKVWPLVIEAGSFRNKDKLLKIAEEIAAGPPADPQAQQEAQIAKQVQLKGALADISETESKTAKNIAEARAKAGGVVAGLIDAQAGMSDRFAPPSPQQMQPQMTPDMGQGLTV